MDSSENYFGWEIGETELDHMKTLNTNAPNTPPAHWFQSGTLDSIAPQTQESTDESGSTFLTSLPSSQSIRDAQPADSPWVSQSYLARYAL